MSFLDRMIDKYHSVFTAPKPPTQTAVIERDRFDEAFFEEVRAAVPAINHQIVNLQREHDYVEDFVEDFFNLAMKVDPVIRQPDEMAPTHIPNASMIRLFADLPEVQQLRTQTVNDKYAAAMAVIAMQDVITEAYEASENARSRAQELADAQQSAVRTTQEALQAIQNAGDGETPSEVAEATRAAETAQEASDVAQVKMQETVDTAADAAASMKSAMRSTAKRAMEDAQKESDLFSTFGVGPGELQHMSFEERMRLTAMLRNNRMAKFTDLIGAFKMMAAQESHKHVATASDEIVGVELGDDLLHLTPQEMTNLAIPELEDDFWVRFTTRQLLVYKLEGRERSGKGPIIAVVDESGSMSNPFGEHGTREAWSKAFALALADQARRQNRDFHYIGFSSQNNVWHLDLPGGRSEFTKIVTMTEHFFGGGTSYEAPLMLALNIVETYYNETGRPKPDIVFISDDEYTGLDEQFMSRWNTVKDHTGLRCFGIAIAASYGGAMTAISDNVRSILDMTSDPREVRDIFRTI